MSVELNQIVSYLDDYLKIAEVPDEPDALNGLQVDNGGSVSRVVAAVDACQATVDAAVEAGADLLLVHHGLFWGGNQPVTGRHFRRLHRLLNHGVAVYSAHIPLDCHPEVGNNAVLATALGVTEQEPFGDYRGIRIGVAGLLKTSRDELTTALGDILQTPPHVMPYGPERVKRIGIVTGAGGSLIRQAMAAGLDTFVTGEGAHYTHFDAEEWGITVMYGGHYATETFGVRALARHLGERFGLPWGFADHPTRL